MKKSFFSKCLIALSVCLIMTIGLAGTAFAAQARTYECPNCHQGGVLAHRLSCNNSNCSAKVTVDGCSNCHYVATWYSVRPGHIAGCTGYGWRW